ncbi:zinc-binding alcohol dehydrogenase family protein [Lentzea kentuckyensis]|uniref:zinc-binding alcohol dehydrogenase family protein n=1 Tax=Lentzea kentuckyensis TaxID=360086 RepID=UPI000A386917|nr:zinc-binding alcohol dehydrogenase family protein [Lentzea kentuckyensis]
MLSWQTTPLRLADVPVPSPAPGELLVRVLACGVCRTDLHVVDGDLPVHRLSVVPGHQVVGEVVVAAPGFVVGERVGIAWLRHTCGTCRFCLRGAENLCPSSLYTGWDADGGYASYAVVPAAYALRLPSGYSSESLAPLLCAGIIGYRALRVASVPDGGRLGIYGFGGSAHLAAQVAVARGHEVHVVTRSSAARALALSLGAASASADVPPVPLDSAVLFAPVGTLVPPALEALDRGGTLAIAGIHLSDVPVLNYTRHLFQERVVRSVTANTRADAAEFLSFCASHRLSVAVQPYPLSSANLALSDLRAGRVTGAAVLVA